MNRAIFIEKLTAVQQTVAQLLAQLQASEADKFVAHLYQARKQYRTVCERPSKGKRRSSARLSQATSLRRASDSKATFAPGSTCCGFTSANLKATISMIDQAFAALGLSFLDESWAIHSDVNISTASESSIHRRPFAGAVQVTARRPRWGSIRT
jgi:hypothetical protein